MHVSKGGNSLGNVHRGCDKQVYKCTSKKIMAFMLRYASNHISQIITSNISNQWPIQICDSLVRKGHYKSTHSHSA